MHLEISQMPTIQQLMTALSDDAWRQQGNDVHSIITPDIAGSVGVVSYAEVAPYDRAIVTRYASGTVTVFGESFLVVNGKVL